MALSVMIAHQGCLHHLSSPGVPAPYGYDTPTESSDSDDDDEPPKRAPRGRDTTGRPDPRDMETMIAAMVRKQMKGSRATSPARDQKKRFIWDKGCHECGGDHMKSECGKWKI